MDTSIYFKGEKLYGDDFNAEKIKEWFQEEKEGYAALGAGDKSSYSYSYHAQNKYFGYKYLPKNASFDVLSIGGAYGDELLPIISSIRSITILEPSDKLVQKDLKGIPITYIKPTENGTMPIGDALFDVITCYGVLHHIPNVTTVMSEIFRVLKPGGFFLVREPIVSMGDWRTSRKGLTKNERGIPYHLFKEISMKTGFSIVKESFCNCKPFDDILNNVIGGSVHNKSFYPPIDKILSALFRFNYQYHTTHFLKKIRPVSIFAVLQKL
jgi:SAM-dependent methyltransferase